MRVAFDTSVLVAALIEPHPFHARALPWLEQVDETVEAECSWHAIAETWSVLTRLPLAPPISPALAEVAVERLSSRVRPVTLDGDLYRSALRRCAERGARSGAVFDALHLLVAESRGAVALVTFNPGDFERLRRAGSPQIVVPPDPPAFSLPEI